MKHELFDYNAYDQKFLLFDNIHDLQPKFK